MKHSGFFENLHFFDEPKMTSSAPHKKSRQRSDFFKSDIVCLFVINVSYFVEIGHPWCTDSQEALNQFNKNLRQSQVRLCKRFEANETIMIILLFYIYFCTQIIYITFLFWSNLRSVNVGMQSDDYSELLKLHGALSLTPNNRWFYAKGLFIRAFNFRCLKCYCNYASWF